MKPSALLADLPLGPGDPRESRLFFRLVVRYLADHVYTAELNSGAHLRDVTDFRQWLEELMAASPETSDADSGAPRQLRLDGSNGSRFLSFCNSCSHVHQEEGECGVDMGPKAGRCACTIAVPA